MLMNLAEWENETTNPVIPGAVKRRPGIHAEALDSRFRGNDGGCIPPNLLPSRGRLVLPPFPKGDRGGFSNVAS